VHSATHKISHCRKQISSINDISWQVFPLLILQGDNYRSLIRLWFSLHKTRILSIRTHPPQHRSLGNTVLINSDWQEKNHYKPDNSSQIGHSFVYETSLRQAWSWCGKILQNLAYIPVTQNSTHKNNEWINIHIIRCIILPLYFSIHHMY